MGRDVARGVEAVTVRINVVTADVLYATIVPIADVAGRTVFVLLTTTEMLVPIVAANREHVRAVVVVDATWLAGHVVTVETVFVIGDVTDGIKSVTVLVQVVAAVRDTFVAVAVPVDVSRVTDLVGLAVGVSVASAKVLRASMATNGVGSRTVVVCGTALCAV